MTSEIVYYYLPGVPRTNAQTGKTTVEELGPYAVGILGSYWRTVDREEIKAYVKELHGVEPTRTEVRVATSGRSG